MDSLDNVSKKKRSQMMGMIRSKNTNPEKIVRSWLHQKGFRFRLHDSSLPGKPDIVLKKYKTVIFVNGCFWHAHDDPKCKKSHLPKSNIEYWTDKIEKNVQRDKDNIRIIEKLGWQVLVIWECELQNEEKFNLLVTNLLKNKMH